jgi:tricorn protease
MTILLLAALALPAEVTDPRYPSVSPDASSVVFCWRGDVWEASSSGGLMRCLTPCTSYESFPSWSPDGTKIAFTSDRTGGGDVYVMPAGGGEAERLTWHGGYDQVMGWSPGSDSVYFRSDREAGAGWLYSVACSGGTSRCILRATLESFCRTPAGIAVDRGFTPWWRRHYSGSASRDVWSVEGEEWTPLVDSPADERWPLWSCQGLLYVAEGASGDAGFWLLGEGGSAMAMTDLAGDVTFPSITPDGALIVFECDGGLWKAVLPGWQVSRLDLSASADNPFPLVVETGAGTFTDGYSTLSDTGQIAVVGEGEVFCGRLSDGSIQEVHRLTRTPGRESSPAWSPDGTRLAFTSEWDGRSGLFLTEAAPADTGFTTFHMPGASEVDLPVLSATDPRWSPDGTRLSYLDEEERLHVLDISTMSDQLVCDVKGIIHHSWSPDGRWLAFSVPDLAHREDVFVVRSGGGDPVNVSRHPNDDFQPFWPADGRRLVFASRTDEGQYSIRQAWLTREDFGADADRREDLLDEPVPEVRIEFDGLQRRTETLCTVEAYYDFYGASPDGRTFAFRAYDPEGGSDLWTVDWKGEGLERLTFSDEEPTEIGITGEGTIYFLGAGDILRSITASGGPAGVLTWSTRTDWSTPERQMQKFDECWRLLRDGFYDPAMHGFDWNEIRERYRTRAAACLLNEDFNDVVSRMLGELSASHLGIYGPWSWSAGVPTGELGMIPDYSWDGPGIRVDSIIPWSPADLPDSRLQPGDLILSIDGVEVGPDVDFYQPLAGTAGEETVLQVRRAGGTFEMTVTPISACELYELSYEAWIERNRRQVSSLTDDRIGYLHIPSMNSEGVGGFLRDLFAEGIDREGMIIDIRDNGGGSTHDQILRELSRPEYLVSRGRSGRVTVEPLGVWQKPIVLLINERCYSDAEIFPAGWKALGIGPVVGNTTYGAVIGTNDVDLVDGTGFRIPSEGWFTLEGVDLENSGVRPDVLVIEMPADFGAGVDRQLEEAARVIMGMLP